MQKWVQIIQNNIQCIFVLFSVGTSRKLQLDMFWTKC